MTNTFETWFHTARDPVLMRAAWTAGAGEDAWGLVTRVLSGFLTAQTALAELSGRVGVWVERAGRTDTALWPVTVSAAGLASLRERAAREAERGDHWWPNEIALRSSAELLLPAGVTSVTAADWQRDEARAHATPLALLPTADGADVPPGFQRWTAPADPDAHEEHAPVHLTLTCDADASPAELALTVASAFELWRPRAFDGERARPGGRESFERLRRAIAAVAVATGGSWELSRDAHEQLAKG